MSNERSYATSCVMWTCHLFSVAVGALPAV